MEIRGENGHVVGRMNRDEVNGGSGFGRRMFWR